MGPSRHQVDTNVIPIPHIGGQTHRGVWWRGKWHVHHLPITQPMLGWLSTNLVCSVTDPSTSTWSLPSALRSCCLDVGPKLSVEIDLLWDRPDVFSLVHRPFIVQRQSQSHLAVVSTPNITRYQYQMVYFFALWENIIFQKVYSCPK